MVSDPAGPGLLEKGQGWTVEGQALGDQEAVTISQV